MFTIPKAGTPRLRPYTVIRQKDFPLLVADLDGAGKSEILKTTRRGVTIICLVRGSLRAHWEPASPVLPFNKISANWSATEGGVIHLHSLWRPQLTVYETLGHVPAPVLNIGCCTITIDLYRGRAVIVVRMI